MAHGYDAVGRNTEIRSGSTTGELLVRNVFDTLKPGLQTSSTRYTNGEAYKTETTGYDSHGWVTGSKITIPSVEGALAGEYEYSVEDFSSTGQPLIEQRWGPNVPREEITRQYTADGQPYSTVAMSFDTFMTRTQVSHTDYSVYGELTQIVRGSDSSSKNVVTTNEYATGTRRLRRSVVDLEGGTVAADRRYSYTDAGTITRIADKPLNGTHDVQCFDRDWRGRLTEAWTPATDDCSQTPSVANMGGAAPYWLEWDFDANGNRTSETEHTSEGDTTRTFEHPDVSETGAGQPHTTTRLLEALPSGSQIQSPVRLRRRGQHHHAADRRRHPNPGLRPVRPHRTDHRSQQRNNVVCVRPVR